jgi:hypothetical protein
MMLGVLESVRQLPCAGSAPALTDNCAGLRVMDSGLATEILRQATKVLSDMAG